jgi:hypothetical protein
LVADPFSDLERAAVVVDRPVKLTQKGVANPKTGEAGGDTSLVAYLLLDLERAAAVVDRLLVLTQRGVAVPEA